MHIHREVGPGDGLFGSYQRDKESITTTPAQIIYQRRLAVLDHNAVVERFHQTILQEGWRPAFHRRHFSSIRQLQAEADSWFITYHHRRRNNGDYMRGRTPIQDLDSHRRNKAA